MVHHKTRSQYARGSMVTWDQRGWYWDMGMGIYVGTAQAKKNCGIKEKTLFISELRYLRTTNILICIYSIVHTISMYYT